MGKVLKWLKANCTPWAESWLAVIIIQALLECTGIFVTAIQGMKTLVCEQRQLLMALEHDNKTSCNIKGPMTNVDHCIL